VRTRPFPDGLRVRAQVAARRHPDLVLLRRQDLVTLLAGALVLALVFNGVAGWFVLRSRTVQPRVVVVPALDPKAVEACQRLLYADGSDHEQMTQIGSAAEQSSIALVHDAGVGLVFEVQQAGSVGSAPQPTPESNMSNLVAVQRAANALMSACVRAGYGGFTSPPTS